MTALVRDLHLQYQSKYDIGVDTNSPAVWDNNPYIKPITEGRRIVLSWIAASKCRSIVQLGNVGVMKHILAWYHYDFTRQTGIPVTVSEPKPDLHLTQEELQPIISGRYWIVMGGGKQDMTNKLWRPEWYQDVIDQLRVEGLRFVQCGAASSLDIQTPLDNCINLAGQTNIREFFSLIQRAEGVICPVTSAVHIAAAFNKPCVVVAGGREDPWFEWYGAGFEAFGENCPPPKVEHQFLHTIGLLPCCKRYGCWKRRTVPIEARDMHPSRLTDVCSDPVRLADSRSYAHCMELITPSHVAEAVMQYYKREILPPITLQEPALDAPVKLNTASEAKKAVQLPQNARNASTGLTAALEPSVVRPPKEPVTRIRPLLAQPSEYVVTKPVIADVTAMDHPIIGGKYTICVFCGEMSLESIQKCIAGIHSSLPRHRMDLRIAATRSVAQEYLQHVGADSLYLDKAWKWKYVAMRGLLQDCNNPINTPYVVWFDGDAFVTDPSWPHKLADAIVANHQKDLRLYGKQGFYDLSSISIPGYNPLSWFQEGNWHRGRQLYVKGTNQPAPNGSCINFVEDWFFAISAAAIHAGDIADKRLQQWGGSVVIGAQVHQAGYGVQSFNQKCQYVQRHHHELDTTQQLPWHPDYIPG